MKKLIVLTLAATVLLAGCGDVGGSGYSVKMKEELLALVQ